MSGSLYVVSTPIGNLDDLSRRALEVLGQVDWVAAEDTRHSQTLLNHLGIKARLISCHDHNEAERSPELVARLRDGEAPGEGGDGYYIRTRDEHKLGPMLGARARASVRLCGWR